jgi:glycolate dehydrogenase iron-sulfur subunit
VPIDPALIDDCVHCGFCLPTCPTYGPLWQREADSPRGRIWLMKGLVEGTVELTDTTVEHFDRCLGCMACMTACPAGVQYDRLIEETRVVIEERYDRAPDDWLLRTLVFGVVPHPRRLRAALSLAPLGRHLPMPGFLRPLVELAPAWRSTDAPAERTPAVGEPRARVGLLTGCVQSVVFGDVNVATSRVLAAEGCEVVAPRGQGCCGALHLHAGKSEEGRMRARALGKRFQELEVDVLVVNAAGCGSHLKDAGLDLVVKDVSELLADLGPRSERKPLALGVAFQDSCHLLHAQRVSEQPRALLGEIPDLVVLEPEDQAICCGSAGIYNLVQPEAARQLGERKAENVVATRPNVYASGNPGCLVQVSSALRRAGHRIPALHPIELLDASISGLSAEALLTAARR